MRDYSEKRDFIRMKVDSEITLTAADSQEAYTGICRDLSSTGMSIEVKQPFLPNSEFDTQLASQNKAFRAFNTRVRVIRCTELGKNKFLLGVEITNIKK